jgi:rubrerythrin
VTTERLDYMPAPWNEAQVAKAIAALERLTEERDRLADALSELLRPCSSCGYMMRSPKPVPLCGDCREYGPPRPPLSSLSEQEGNG